MTRREAISCGIVSAAAFLKGSGDMESVSTPPLLLDASHMQPPHLSIFSFGAAERPGDGMRLTADGTSLLRGTDRWIPAMGECHFTRLSPESWLTELRKMKAGGLDIVSTYVFWIHHEEAEGVWDWSGRRDLRQFLQACHEAGLSVIVRLGPWCHGEVCNGGLPDWLVARKDIKTRSNDPQYLELATKLYQQICEQARGLLWKDGGPIAGVQIENEFGGPAEHLLALKKIAVDAGFDVPIYTRTGWPGLHTPMPYGELLPLSGAYAEGFWDRALTPMPGHYPDAFRFGLSAEDAAAAIGTDLLGAHGASDSEGKPAQRYPYLCCEMGGGMMSSYHRRIRMAPADVESLAIVKLGSGNNLPGFYMYHGGVNPEGKTPLQESQATGYWNDLPQKNYDFQAPLGAFGQVRPHYHRLRRMHLFLRDFGSQLAAMGPVLPAKQPVKGDDTLRWSARTDGQSGFVFVNNYERLRPMLEKKDVQFALKMANGETLTLPQYPVTVQANSYFFWPFRWPLGSVVLRHATAQPLCLGGNHSPQTWVFSVTPGVPTEFAFEGAGIKVVSTTARKQEVRDGCLILIDVQPGTGTAITLDDGKSGRIHIVLLTDEQARACWKDGEVYLSPADALLLDAASGSLELSATDTNHLAVSVLENGSFRKLSVPKPMHTPQVHVTWEHVKPAGTPPPVQIGPQKVATPPDDVTFNSCAAVWRIRLPEGIEQTRDLLLHIRYHGDSARLTLGGRLILDDFYNGGVFEIGLREFAPAIYKEELLLHIYPLQKDAPVYFSDRTVGNSGAELTDITVVETVTVKVGK